VGLSAIVALGIAWAWCCGGSAAVAADRPTEVATLTRLSDDWDKAIVRKDEKAISDNMS